MVILESPDPASVYVCSPGICRLDDGRLVVTDGLRGAGLAGERFAALAPRYGRSQKVPWQGKVFTSDDHGRSWTHRHDMPIVHCRPFAAGKSVYVLGHDDDLLIMRSDDRGETWSEVSRLTDGQVWHQAPSNVWYANGCVYLVMERRVSFEVAGWPVSEFAPVLMRGRIGDDLLDRASWSFASELPFQEALAAAGGASPLAAAGIPFFEVSYPQVSYPAQRRGCAPIGWLETNVIQIHDPAHYWCDPSGGTFHLLLRAHTGGSGFAALARVVEDGAPGTGPMRTGLQPAPSGRPLLYLPMPGGQMKFHLLHDEPSATYWLLATVATDSTRRLDALPADRYNLPNNERRRLGLWFSDNCIDWRWAGLVAQGEVEVASRHYAAMAIDGDDLQIVSRSGDAHAHNAHDGNIVTFHSVRRFRDLLW